MIQSYKISSPSPILKQFTAWTTTKCALVIQRQEHARGRLAGFGVSEAQYDAIMGIRSLLMS